MAKKVDIDGIFAAIAEELNDYSREVNEKVNKAKLKRANEGVRTVKATSPVGARGEYAKGWRKTIRGSAVVIHNTHYQLTHLLERGHATRGGNRTQAQPHIGPMEEQVVKDFISDVEKAVGGK